MHNTAMLVLFFLVSGICAGFLSVFPSLAAAKYQVVATVAPITDIVRRVAGDAVHLHGLVPEGVNAHTFHLTPSDVRYLAEADMIILNGLYLEVATEKLARRSGKPEVIIVKLGDQAITPDEWAFDARFPLAQHHPNPHLWLNVAHAMTYVTLIRDQLSALDPENATRYRRHAAQYLADLTALDQCIAATMATIPHRQRQLLTYHDSWPYFARRYGMTVIGAIQPASFSEPSPREVARIIDQIRATQAPAIFGSEVFPSTVLEKIAAEAGVHYIATLRDDVLPGKPGEAQHSYMGMMVANVQTMAEALGGITAALDPCAARLRQ